KDPIARGLYLCQLHGIEANLETNTAMPVQFLMKQMEWREALDDHADDLEALERLAAEVEQSRHDSLLELTDAFEQSAYGQAVDILRGLLFINKFATELDDAIAQLV
ncbi:MAG: Fe-S protein assembly co-chaperone HscB, partial [Burkholderiaceae bacterium]|nr:Fe-S protein assembly co-chaperone HscB [Burkholderiaceae bacterium]